MSSLGTQLTIGQLFQLRGRVVEEKLRAHTGALLVTYLGLLARYGNASLLARFSGHRLAHCLWVLVAGDEQTGRPTIDDVPARAAGTNKATEIPPIWLTQPGGLR